jgi:hypothetical protein
MNFVWARRSFRQLTLILILTSCASANAQNAYFPKQSFDSDSKLNKFLDDYYTLELKLLGEAPFVGLSRNPSAHSYRFLWLRTFHHPISIRLDIQQDNTGILTTKVAGGAAGYPRKGTQIIENTSRTLTSYEVNKFLSKVDQVKFWQVPSCLVGDQTGTDGSNWIIEAVRGGRYHVAARWTPTANEQSKLPVRELGLALAIDLAQLKIPANELY